MDRTNLHWLGQQCHAFLGALQSELLAYPAGVLGQHGGLAAPRYEIEPAGTAVPRGVFIIHGHDEVNLLRLEKLCDRWHLQPVILRYEPGQGRTLIEMIEEQTLDVSYALALLTDDDLVEVSGTDYFQARPNVMFELGWFYGRLGRSRVCILLKKGTKTPSDLEGSKRIEFTESVEEKVIELETELRAAGIVPSNTTD